MDHLKREPTLGIINSEIYEISQAGPLHEPIHSFTLHRDEKLQITLQTVADRDAISNAVDYAPGTVRINTDQVVFINPIANSNAVATGVQPLNSVHEASYDSQEQIRETASIYTLRAVFDAQGSTAYTIDWLANKDNYYIWTESIKDKTTVTETREICQGAGGPVINMSRSKTSSSLRCLPLSVSGIKLYLYLPKDADNESQGFVLYEGAPCEDTRQKIRTCLSFCLGIYLVHLGSCNYSENWELLSSKVISAYSLDGKAFDIPTLPPTFITSRGRNDISKELFGHIFNAIYSNYECLNFGHLSWLYWHAVSSPVHNAGVQFGAAIEALQKSYIAANKDRINTKLLEKNDWKTLRNDMEASISKLAVDDTIKIILMNKAGDFNKPPQNIIAERLFNSLNLQFSEQEKLAWNRRNDAGHGNEIEEGEYIQLIRDVKLLRIRFNRLILSITNASSDYYDYYTPGHRIRALNECVPNS